jgi:hypothetical protein
MRLYEFYKIYSGTFVVGLAAEEIYSYVRDMRSRTVNRTVVATNIAPHYRLENETHPPPNCFTCKGCDGVCAQSGFDTFVDSQSEWKRYYRLLRISCYVSTSARIIWWQPPFPFHNRLLTVNHMQSLIKLKH